MDLNLSLTKSLQNNDILVLNEQQAIRNSIKNLILTRKGERIFQPYIGTSLESLLFEIIDENTADTIIEQIKKLISIYEPRIFIDSIEVFEQDDRITLSVSILYTILKTNTQDSFNTLLVSNK